MGRAMGFGSEPTCSTHVVRQQRIRARARGGEGCGGAVQLYVEKCRDLLDVVVWDHL